LRFNSLDVLRTASRRALMVPLLQGAKYLGDEQPTQNWYGQGSGRQNNVGKGSRQNRSVTSGKGLAPRLHAGVGVDRARGSGDERLREAPSGATRGSLNLPFPSACCAYNEAATWNCYEQGESNWLIKP